MQTPPGARVVDITIPQHALCKFIGGAPESHGAVGWTGMPWQGQFCEL